MLARLTTGRARAPQRTTGCAQPQSRASSGALSDPVAGEYGPLLWAWWNGTTSCLAGRRVVSRCCSPTATAVTNGCGATSHRRSPDFRTVCFDHVGAGRSDLAAYDPERYRTLDGYATDVLEICEALELHDVVFVGHSVAAMIGVLAANRAPERFDKLVFVGPSPRYIDDDDYVGGFSRRRHRRAAGRRSTATTWAGRTPWPRDHGQRRSP